MSDKTETRDLSKEILHIAQAMDILGHHALKRIFDKLTEEYEKTLDPEAKYDIDYVAQTITKR